MPEHETYAADHPERGAMVGCSTCGWLRWLDDVPSEILGMARIEWLLDQRDLHAQEGLKERGAGADRPARCGTTETDHEGGER